MKAATCIVPFCGLRATGEADDEALCDKHWLGAAGPLRARYEAAWAEANRADTLGVEDVDACVRVNAAWEDLKAHVIGRAV